MGAMSEHFSNQELACKHCGRNECTVALVSALESFRTILQQPILINDAYRCPEHNQAVGGVPDSQHVLGNAADIRVEGMPAAKLEQMALSSGLWGGIGRDDRRNYVHVDVRMKQIGKPVARWCYDADGKTVAWYASESFV